MWRGSAELQAIYVMWLRQMKRFIRARSRLVASIVQPLFFLVFLGFGLQRAVFPGVDIPYLDFLAPGIIAMSIMFSSMFAGISVLWDKQFGFLQEVLVAPVSRLSIIFGRTLGGATTALVQGFFILIIALFLGVNILTGWSIILSIILMVLLAFSAVGFGLILASKMEDFHGFQLVMTLIILPLFFLSGAFIPISNFPEWLKVVSYLNPVTYAVDGLRNSLVGFEASYFPLHVDFIVILLLCIVMMGLGSYFFSKSEV